MSDAVLVNFDPKNNKLEVMAPIWQLDKCRGIPVRRWNKSRKTWVTPPLRRNVEYLRATFPQAQWTPLAHEVATQVLTFKPPPKLGFPAWYKFKRQPKIKAREALDKAWGMREFGLFLGVGGGKTQWFIDWASALAMEGSINAALVIVPNSVTHNWLEELAEVCPIEYKAAVMDTGSYRVAEAAIAAQGVFKWLIMSWESLSQGKAAAYAERFVLSSRCAIAGDESQWAKNHKSIRTDKFTNLMLQAQYRAIMTGTSVLKTLEDLYSQLEALNTNIIGIGDFYAYRNRYVVMGGYEDKKVVGYQNVDELMELIQPYVFAAKTRECTDLPPKTPEDSPPGILRRVELTKAQRDLYKTVRSKFAVPEFQGKIVPVKNTLEVALRARQVCQGIVTTDTGRKDKNDKPILEQRYIVPWQLNPKIQELLRLVEELDDDQQVLVWSPFVLDVEAATEALRSVYGYKAVCNLPDGDPAGLQYMTRQFRAGEYRFMVSTQQRGGVGINNLQSASVCIYLANTESLGDRLQSEGRMERTGQEKPMFVYDIVADNTVDTRTMMPSLREKCDISDFVMQRLSEGGRPEDLL